MANAKATEWVDMSAAVFIEKITRKLGLSELWNADGALIGPSAFKKAEAFIKKNKHEVTLSFGIVKPSVKKLLNSWGGHELKIHTRVETHTIKFRLRLLCAGFRKIFGGSPSRI